MLTLTLGTSYVPGAAERGAQGRAGGGGILPIVMLAPPSNPTRKILVPGLPCK